LTEEKADDLNADAVEGDLLFTAAGTIGQVGMIPKEAAFKRYVISNKQIRFRANAAKADSDFLYAWLASPWIFKAITNRNTGSTVPLINLGIVRSLPVLLPDSVSEQKRIAAVLAALDAKMACNNRINAELEAMAKTLYDYWFVQFDFPDANGKPYQSSGGKMVYNATLKREIPAGWQAKSLADLGGFKNGINYDPSVGGDSEARIVNVRDISATTVFLESSNLDVLKLDQSDIDKYLVTHDSILIARSGIPGATRMMASCPQNTIYCGFIICFTVGNPEDKLAIFFKLKQIEQSLLSQSSGSILKNVSQDTLKALCLAMPSKDYQSISQQFNVVIDPILGKLNLNQQENQHLAQLRDWLLPLLMNGQVTVA